MTEKKQPKTRLQIALERKARLVEEEKETAKRIKLLKAKAERNDSIEKRNIEKRLKTHAGGMVEMTGLMRYVYPEGVKSDNPQDMLIANLLVGAFQKLAYDLETMPVEELQELWGCGQKFRREAKKDRVLPKVNPNLSELINSVQAIKAESATSQQPNDNVQAEKSVV